MTCPLLDLRSQTEEWKSRNPGRARRSARLALLEPDPRRRPEDHHAPLDHDRGCLALDHGGGCLATVWRRHSRQSDALIFVGRR